MLDLNSIVLIVITSLSVGVTAFLVTKSMKKGRYDDEQRKAILEDARRSLERQIYNLNDRLVQNEERWKDVNHLLLRSEYSLSDSDLLDSKKTHYSKFLESNGIAENDLVIDERLIFVLTPFHPDSDDDFRTIRETCSAFGYKCIRGDEEHFRGDIFPQVLKRILKARLVIANINGRSPNVMYELGVAQAMDKPVLLVSRKPKDLPVDIKSQRFLIYNDFPELDRLLRLELSKLAY